MGNDNLFPVPPLGGVVPWVGGKRLLAKHIAGRISCIPHTCYAEPFVGAGGLFFRRPQKPAVEAINDRSKDVSTLFRVLQRHPDALLGALHWQLNCRDEFDRLVASNPDTLTDIERSARFVAIQFQSFGGRADRPMWAGSATREGRLSVVRLRKLFSSLHRRLDRVFVDSCDFGDFIRRWDRPSTLFYLDPPYFRCEDYYGKDLFCRADFERLADQLAGIKGRFLLSLNDAPEVRVIFGRFGVEVVKTTYSLNGRAGSKKAEELIISN